MTITHDDDVPRIEGFDVTVIDIYNAHARDGLEPAEVADEYGVPMARVHEALAYYYDHSDLMRRLKNNQIVDETPNPDPENNDLFFDGGIDTPTMDEFIRDNQDADDL